MAHPVPIHMGFTPPPGMRPAWNIETLDKFLTLRMMIFASQVVKTYNLPLLHAINRDFWRFFFAMIFALMYKKNYLNFKRATQAKCLRIGCSK